MAQKVPRLSQLIRRYLRGKASEDEQKKVQDWYESFDSLPIVFLEGDVSKIADSERNSLKVIWSKIHHHKNTNRAIFQPYQIRKIAASLLILMVCSISGYWIWNKHLINTKRITSQEKKIDFPPGGNKAILTLSNGKTIVLDSQASGLLAMQGGTQILVHAGQIRYQGSPPKNQSVAYNTLSTPAGGTYQLILADGTRVWLNANSSIHFPTAFNGKNREVEIIGEAYFEVTKNKLKPFIVRVKGAKIEVLGTHFDIKAYEDENQLYTTLLEGSIRLTSSNGEVAVLTPGEQAKIKDHKLSILTSVNTDQIIAWKNNLFWFDNDNLKIVARELERWYNVHIIIKDSISDLFTGSIPRNMSFTKVFEILQKTGSLHYQIIDTHTVMVFK